MAQHDVSAGPSAIGATESDAISACLGRLRRSLQWRSDVDDIVAEIEDHLRETAERLVNHGADPREAPALALARLGEPDVVARSFVQTPSGGIAVPTRLTRKAGTAALLAAALWVVSAMLSPLATDLVVPWQQSYYSLWSGSVVLAAVATVVAVGGLLVRSAVGVRLAGPAVGTLLLGTAALVAGTWLWQVGAGLMALGALLALRSVRAQNLRPSTMDWLVLGAPLGATAHLVVERFDSGALNGTAGTLLGFGIVAAANAVALAHLGSWLRSETPADLDDKQIVT